MNSTSWSSDLTERLQKRFGDEVTEYSTYLAQNFLVCSPGSAIPIIRFLKTDHGYDFLVDITAVDYPKRNERFDLIYTQYSFTANDRVRVKTMVHENARPASATPVFAGANWLEREIFDMFGIEFEGHPDLRRILLPEEWSGFPLRKDHSILKQDEVWVRENLGIKSGQ